MQSLLALLVREEGLIAEPNQATDWDTWIRLEASTRTKLIAYCFFNLCSIAYNTPPLLLTSEMHLYLPNPSRLWRAESAWQWQELRQSYPNVEIPLQDAFSRLLNRPSQGPPSPMTSLGSYVLIHALVQHIFLLKQTSFASLSPFEVHRGLKMEDVEEVTQALRLWTIGFEQHRQLRANEQGAAAQGTNGDGVTSDPVAFNSTALLRLAYIRLYTDLSPSRSLETRDHVLIASSFSDASLLVRSQRLCRAVMNAIHPLAMLVKQGVNYVARTKSLEWSMQHSRRWLLSVLSCNHDLTHGVHIVCNLECAVLLSKWLLTLASMGPADPPLNQEEKGLLETVRRMLDETEFAVPIDPSLAGGASGSGGGSHHRQSSSSVADISGTDGAKLRQLASAVVRLWAETFKGTHIFEIVRIMAAGLEGYADLIEKPRDRTPLGRMSNAGLG